MTVDKSSRPGLNYNVIPMVSGVLLVLDFLSLLFSLLFSKSVIENTYVFKNGINISVHGFVQVVLLVAIPALFVLYDKHFGAIASRGNMWRLMRLHFIRFMVFASFVLVLCSFDKISNRFPVQALLVWMAAGLSLTSVARLVVAYTVRRFQRKGELIEVVAIVGAGQVADRLVEALERSQGNTVELLGVFDDKVLNAPDSKIKSTGTVDDLLEIGKSRKIDWILMTLPATAEQRVQELTQRLKALSVPIGLCPQHVGLTIPYRIVDFVNGTVPVSILAGSQSKRWDEFLKSAEYLLPRWIVTLLILPLFALGVALKVVTRHLISCMKNNNSRLTLQLANKDAQEFTDLAEKYGNENYGYVVTPNVDHIIRLHEDAAYREIYADATYTLLDSRFLSRLLRKTKRVNLPVCTGSDLTQNILSNVVMSEDEIVIIGGTHEQAAILRERYNLRRLHHYNPPMGFINDPNMVELCLDFIESHSPFRFCFLAVGSPRQEVLAHQLRIRGVARGLALCIGASIDFVTGNEQRAPTWMQQSGIEWMFRLLQAPKRMAKRYLIRGPRIFRLLLNTEFLLHEVTQPAVNEIPEINNIVESGGRDSANDNFVNTHDSDQTKLPAIP